jgi:hypothetical protein
VTELYWTKAKDAADHLADKHRISVAKYREDLAAAKNPEEKFRVESSRKDLEIHEDLMKAQRLFEKSQRMLDAGIKDSTLKSLSELTKDNPAKEEKAPAKRFGKKS